MSKVHFFSQNMDYCMCCEEYRNGVDLIDCGHQFCPECNSDRKLDGDRCPICSMIAKPIQIESELNGAELYQQIQNFHLQVKVLDVSHFQIQQRYQSLKSVDGKDQLLNDWHLSALKIQDFNEDLVKSYNQRVTMVQQLVQTITQDSDPTLLFKIGVIIQRLIIAPDLNPNPLPLAYWYQRLSFESSRDYSRLHPQLVQKSNNLRECWDTNGKYYISGSHIYSVEHNDPSYLTYHGWSYRFIGENVVSQGSYNIDIRLPQKEIIASKTFSNLVWCVVGSSESIYLLTVHHRYPESRIVQVTPQLEEIRQSLSIHPFTPVRGTKLLLGETYLYLYHKGRMYTFRKSNLTFVRSVPIDVSETFLFDRLNKVVLNHPVGSNRLQIYDDDMNFIGSSSELYPEDQKGKCHQGLDDKLYLTVNDELRVF